jgi:DNA-binding MarR family transcriptional regulator
LINHIDQYRLINVVDEKHPDEVADALRISVGLLFRRLRQTKDEGGLSLPEALALSRLDREGPATGAELARREHISPQAMAMTLRGLEQAGLIERSADPRDGRRVTLSLTEAGRSTVASRRSTSGALIAERLRSDFTGAEIDELERAAVLLERLALGL